MSNMFELIDIWPLYLRDTQINLFLDLWVFVISVTKLIWNVFADS